MKVLHLCVLDKFIPPFIDFVREYLDNTKHFFIVIGDRNKYPFTEGKDTICWQKNRINSLLLIKEMNKADKIILHSLFNMRIVKLLFLQPWLLKKCYWIIWGGDLYSYKLDKRDWKWRQRELFRKPVIKNMGHLVTGTTGDYELVKKWYGSKSPHIKCFNYPSNMYKDYRVPEKVGNTVSVLVGNSADPANNHIDIFEKIRSFLSENIVIYSPLSYGDLNYAQQVMTNGEAIFGKKFKPLLEFMLFDRYLELLGQIDVAVFAHRRQQALGTIITLLGLGKKVYIRSNSSLWELFKEYDIKVYDYEYFDLSPLNNAVKMQNIEIIKSVFSRESLIRSLKAWIE